MTIEAFNEIYAVPWARFKGTAMFQALKAVMAAHSPAKLNAKRPPADVLHAGQLFFVENQGYEQLVEIIENKLGATKPKQEVMEADYSEPQVQVR